MKKSLLLTLTLCSAVVLTGCKSKESAYRQAYEKAKAQEMAGNNENTAAVTPVENNRQVNVTPVTPPARPANPVDHSDVRTIAGGFNLVSGNPLKTYSVVVGSFQAQTNAESLMSVLKDGGYDARVVKTNETINGHTGWFRVIACSYDDKATAAQMRSQLNSKYNGAWLLSSKK